MINDINTIFLIYVSLMFIILVFATLYIKKHSLEKEIDSQINEITKDLQKGITKEKYVNVLEFMFQCGIISSIEYTNYLNAGLPYVKRNRP